MELFNEYEFVWCLTVRPEDARVYSQIFQPDWLRDPALKAVLSEIYKFTKEHGTPPTIPVLDKIFFSEDEVIYAARYKPALDKVRMVNLAIAEQIYLLKQAKDVAIVRSLEAMYQDINFQTKMVGQEGSNILKDVTSWINNFAIADGEQSADLKQAWEKLVQENAAARKTFQAPTGIQILDEWTYGGLRSKQLGIFMAPTGEGKSAILMNIAYNLSLQDEWNVWFVTNELSLSEQAERLLSRASGVPLPQIQHELGTVDANFKKNWDDQVNARLRITSVNSDLNCHEIENMMMRWASISGWKPDILILDFMERMNPNDKGYERRAEWQWLGAIAKDLVRMAKAQNMVMWTACQTNRSGTQSDLEMTMQMAQSSIRHFQEASVVVGMRKCWGTEHTECLELKALKMRHGVRSNRSRVIRCNLETMLITNEEFEKEQNLSDDEEDVDEQLNQHTASRANPRGK